MNIVIVDDQLLFRQGLVNMVQSQPDMTVVGQAGSLHEAIKTVLGVKPDLVLMDLLLPDGDGLEAMKAILSHLPETRIIILTAHDSEDMLVLSFLNGAKGYLLKNTPISKLLVSLRAVYRGEIALSRAMTGRVLDEFTRVVTLTNHFHGNVNNLTARELEVLQLLGTGATNREIASTLFIAENTVKIYVHNIYEKLKLRNRREAMRFARRSGLVKANGIVESINENNHLSPLEEENKIL